MYMDNWRPGGTDWMDLDLVGQQSGALVAFVLPVSIKDCSLHGPWSSHISSYPEHILADGGLERLVTLLSWALALSGPTDWRRG
jgi:hypothetical protein